MALPTAAAISPALDGPGGEKYHHSPSLLVGREGEEGGGGGLYPERVRSRTTERRLSGGGSGEDEKGFRSPDDVENSDDDADEEEPYPEGGWKAWSVVFGSWCGLCGSLGIMNSLGTFQDYISRHQLSNYSASEIGWIFSVYTFMAWFGGIFIGPIFDKYGPRWLILSGTVCVSGGMLILGECTEYWHFILDFGVVTGFGTALIFTPAVAAVAHWFLVGRGNATGIACTGGSMGGIIFPFLFEKLIPEVGFAWSSRIAGFVCLFLCVIGNILIRSRLPPSQHASAYPDAKIFKNIPFTITTAAIFLIEWGLFIPMAYISSYALSEGFSQDFAFDVIPIMNVGSVFGRWLPGLIADRVGRYNALIGAVLLSIVMVMGVWLPAGGSTAGIVVFVLIFGFASGGYVSLTPVCIGQLCPTEQYGRHYATCYFVVAFGCLTGIPIGGEILAEDGGHYWGLKIFVGACYVGALISLVTTRVMCKGWRIDVKY